MSSSQRIRIWDLPTRLFHWLLVICVAGAFITVKVGGFWVDYHFIFGHGILALLAFRLLWGLTGPRHARFVHFVRGPRAILASLRRQPTSSAGHSPLAALSVLAMLAALLVQAITGLFANDGIMSEGPLARYASDALSDTLTGIHLANEPVLLTLIGLHILAIVWYVAVRRRLVRAMLTGDKRLADVPPATEPSRDDAPMRIRGAIIAVLSAGLSWWIASLGNIGF